MTRRTRRASARKRLVLIVSEENLLGDALKAVLARAEDIEVMGPLTQGDQATARRASLPDVVLVAEEGAVSAATDSTPKWIEERYPGVPVICVNLNQDSVHLIISRSFPARGRYLIETIRNLPLNTSV